MESEILQRNMQYISGDLLAMLPDRVSTDIHVVDGEQGWPVARLTLLNQTVYTNSLIDPWQEAAAWADTLDYKDVFVSFIYGCGFGYPLLEYAKRRKPYTITVIFEHHVELFYAMLRTIDLEPLLNNGKVFFVIGNSDQMKEQIGMLFSADFLLYATKPATFFTWLAHRNEKNTYLAIHEWLFNNLQLSLANVGNSVHDSLVGMYNMIDNVKHVFGNPRVSSLQKTFHGKPAIIVANGPSLDKNIDGLFQAMGKAIILTAESALQPCLKRNIIPDAVCITERTPNTYNVHFKNKTFPQRLSLIGLNLMDPRIPEAFPGPWVPIFREYESTSRWINDTISDGCGFNGGSSSAHLAFEFALWLGCSPIILIGQDLAFGPDLATHSKESSYFTNEQMAEHITIIQAQPKLLVKGNDGQMIPTTKFWQEFKTWFEQQIEQHSDISVINATEGGAYIAGATLMTIREAVEQYCNKELDTSLFDIVQSSRCQEPDEDMAVKYRKLIGKIDEVLETFTNLAVTADQDIRNCKIVEKSCEMHIKYKGNLPAFIRELYQTNFDAFRKYGSKEEVIAYTQSIIYATYKKINDIGEAENEERLLEITKLLKEMYVSLKECCLLLNRHFTMAKERLERQMRRLGGDSQ